MTAPIKPGPGAYKQVWDGVIGPAIDEALKPLKATNRDVPRELLHFTSAATLSSILQRRVLRLSAALTSNDPLEMKHGIGLARRYLAGMQNGPEGDVYRQATEASFRGEYLNGAEKRLPSPHVCCFANPDCEKKIEHWAMYGRGGSGCVLVFDSLQLSSNVAADLVPVVYEESKQVEMFRKLFEVGKRTALEAQAYGAGIDKKFGGPSFSLAAHSFGIVASYFAASMKSQEWQFEQESRLLKARLGSKADQLNFGADATGPIVRTYFEFPFKPHALKAVVVGMVHADLNRAAIHDLLEAGGYSDTAVRTGTIALRTIA